MAIFFSLYTLLYRISDSRVWKWVGLIWGVRQNSSVSECSWLKVVKRWSIVQFLNFAVELWCRITLAEILHLGTTKNTREHHCCSRAVESESRSRKDFQPEESDSQKMLTTPTLRRPFARRLWLFVPQTCVSVTFGNLSSLALQQEMIMVIQIGGSALTCIPTLQGESTSAASLGLITQPTLSECNHSRLASLKFPFAHFGWNYRCSVTLVTQQWVRSSHGNSSIVT